MKRYYQARKYKGGIGAPLAYDRDGQLQDRSLTLKSAREMVAMLQSLIPDLAKHQIKVVVSRSLHRRGEYRPYTQTIYLYARGHNEGTLLHEIAHVTNPVTRGTGTKHIIHGAGFKSTLLRYEKVWRQHNKLRTRRVIVPVPDERSESKPPKKTRARRHVAPYVPPRPPRPPQPESRLHRLVSWVVRVICRALERPPISNHLLGGE
jgi:hypothetical protein